MLVWYEVTYDDSSLENAAVHEDITLMINNAILTSDSDI